HRVDAAEAAQPCRHQGASEGAVTALERVEAWRFRHGVFERAAAIHYGDEQFGGGAARGQGVGAFVYCTSTRARRNSSRRITARRGQGVAMRTTGAKFASGIKANQISPWGIRVRPASRGSYPATAI